MRPWTVVTIAIAGALAGELAWVVIAFQIPPQPWPSDPSDLWASIGADNAANLLIFGLASYVGTVILLVTASVWTDLRRVRSRIIYLSTPLRSGWFAAFARTGLANLVERIVDLAPPLAPDVSEDLLLQSRLIPSTIRSELLHHYRDQLTRAHAFTAFAGLLLIAVIGLTQHFAVLTLIRFEVPIAGTLAAISVLVIFGGLSLLTVVSGAEGLLSAIARLPFRMAAAAPAPSDDDVPPLAACPITASPAFERLAITLEQASDALRKAVTRLSATTKILAALAQGEAARTVDTGGVEQLNTAIQELSNIIGENSTRLSVVSPPLLPSAERTRIREELRDLLADLE